MSRTHVLRIPRSDGDEGFVVGHVTPSSSKKAKPLDVKLVATEGENPYVVSLHHNKIDNLRSSGSPCSSEEWEHILESLLLGRDTVEDIEVTAAVKSKRVDITVRKRIQGITQRLGDIRLERNDNEEDSDVLEWCGVAIEARDTAQAELASVTAKAQELEEAVASLRTQLEELIQAKEEHESELMAQFCALLNSKKRKIREQLKALTAAGIDPVLLTPVQGSRKQDAAGGPAPKVSRRSKRKAGASGSGDDDSDDGVEGQAVDLVKKEYEKDNGPEELSEDEKTTEDDDATASEPEPEDDGGSMEEVSKAAEPLSKSAKGKQRERAPSLSDLPPPRVLPFAKEKAAPAAQAQKSAAAPAQPAEGSETESDDEL